MGWVGEVTRGAGIRGVKWGGGGVTRGAGDTGS